MLGNNNVAQGTGLAGSTTPTKANNTKTARITQVANGFLIEMQNVEDYQMTNNVATDFDSAANIVKEYFA